MFNFLKNLSRKRKFQSGVIPDPRPVEEKEKDYQSEEVAKFTPVIWREKPESEWRKFPIFDQAQSGSCLAQSVAKVLGIENWLEEGKFVWKSARDIYTRRINAPEEGMWFNDAMEIGHKVGATIEQLMPSQRMDEAQMNVSSDRKTIDEQIALVGKGGNYFWIPHNIDRIASIIEPHGRGVVIGARFTMNEWNRPVPVILGTAMPLHHAVCFSPDVRVLTYNGYKNISDIKKGELVYTHKNRFQKVKEVMKRKYDGEILNIKIRNGIGNIRITPEHPVLMKDISANIKEAIKRGKKQGIDKFSFDEVKNINKNTVFVNGIIPTYKNVINKDEAFLLGAYIGDGNLRKTYYSKVRDFEAVRFCLGYGKKEVELKNKIIEKMNSVFNAVPKIYPTKDKSFQMVYYNAKAVKFFEEYGGVPHNKNIKQEVLYCDKDILQSLIDGWTLTDGSIFIQKNGAVCKKIFTSKENLAYQCKLILDKLNYSYNIFYRKPSDIILKGKPSKQRGGWSFNRYEKAKQFQNHYLGEHQFIRAKEIKSENYSGCVYNIEVEKDNTYIADGMIVHNCAHTAILYKGKKALVVDESWGSLSTTFNGRRIITEDWFTHNRISAALHYMPLKNTWRDGGSCDKPKHQWSRDMLFGQTNLDIEKLQEALMFEEFFPQLQITTGFYGNITARAVRDFNTNYGIVPTTTAEVQGRMVGRMTRDKLNELFA